MPTCVPYDPSTHHDDDDLRRHCRAVLPNFDDHYRAHDRVDGADDGQYAHHNGAFDHHHLGAGYSTQYHYNHRATHNDNHQPADHHNDYYGAYHDIYHAAAADNFDNEAPSHDYDDTGSDDNGNDPVRPQDDYASPHHYHAARPDDEAPSNHRDDASAPHHDEAPADDSPSAPHDDDRAPARHTPGNSHTGCDHHHKDDHPCKDDTALDNVHLSPYRREEAPYSHGNDTAVPADDGP